jgi:hypothetical protein
MYMSREEQFDRWLNIASYIEQNACRFCICQILVNIPKSPGNSTTPKISEHCQAWQLFFWLLLHAILHAIYKNMIINGKSKLKFDFLIVRWLGATLCKLGAQAKELHFHYQESILNNTGYCHILKYKKLSLFHTWYNAMFQYVFNDTDKWYQVFCLRIN